MNAPRILFLDDDHVLQILRMVLRDGQDDPRLRAWFAPEQVDLQPLADATRGLRVSDGARVAQLGEPGADALDAHVIILRRGEIDARVLDAHPSLRLIQRFGERADGLDLAQAQRRGVRVSCLPRRTIHFTAEHVLMLALALGKKLLEGDRAVRAGAAGEIATGSVAYNWAGIAGAKGLHGSTLGIVGLGEIGSVLARLAVAFGMQVIYTKPRRAAPDVEVALGVTYASLPELLARSDYVSLNLPNVAETVGFANAAFFSGMKRSAFFINTSRGALVQEGALYQALVGGTIAGAGLDVHAQEPRPVGDRLAALPNVVLTPHLAGGARSGVLEEFAVMARNCRAALEGREIAHRLA